MKVMVTGHRPRRIKGNEEKITNWFKKQLSEINNIEECISGCCRGVDRLFADVVIEKNLPLLCAFPLKHELNRPESAKVRTLDIDLRETFRPFRAEYGSKSYLIKH